MGFILTILVADRARGDRDCNQSMGWAYRVHPSKLWTIQPGRGAPPCAHSQWSL